MKIVSSAAKHLGINGIDFPVAADPAGKFDAFLITVSGKATELRLDGINIGDPNSVRISVNGISLIYDQIAILKKTIQKSDISNDTKQRLLARLKELESEIEKPRASFSQIMGVLALVAAGVGGTTSFLADAPQAIATITAIVGNEKQSEEEELKRLGLERPKLLPAPTEDSGNLDDEIPF